MRSIIVFCLTGGITTVVHITVGLTVHRYLGIDPFNANLIAFCFGFMVSYFGHRHFTFRSPGRVRRSMPRFFVIAAVSLVLNQLIVFTFVNLLGYSYNVALAVMVVVVPTFTYLGGRLWAFSDGDF